MNTKIVNRMISILIAITMIFCTVPIFSSASSDSVQKIFDFLVDNMGLTPAAACGVIANIEYESDFDCNLLGDSGTSYGICQWHNSRWENLKDYCSKNNLSWKTLDGQLNFLKYELTNYGCDTGYILSKLKNIENTAEGAYEAAYKWCYYFERPANKEYQSDKRGTRAKNYYWSKYGQPATALLTSSDYSVGDVNNDGKVDSSDSLSILNFSVGNGSLDSTQKKSADINSNSKINSEDALIILKIAVGSDKISNYK